MKRGKKRITTTEKYSREAYQDKYWTEWATRKAHEADEIRRAAHERELRREERPDE